MVFGRRPVARSPPAKRFVDIEQALWWAYRDELPKRGPRGGRWASIDLPAVQPMFRPTVSSVGHRDDADREPGFPAASGDPHPDSLVIEAAVKGLASWTGHRFADGVMAELIAGIPLGFDPISIAAEAIAAMPGHVTIDARIGARPKWSRETPTPHWDNGGNGKPRVLIDEMIITKDGFGRELEEVVTKPCPATRKEVYREGAYCPIRWRPDPARLLEERAEWCAWRAALEILAAELEGKLAAVAVLPPAAPWFPWAGETDAHGRAGQPFAALRETPHRRLTREQHAIERRRGMRRALAARDADATPPRHPTSRVVKRGNEPA